MDDSLNSSSTAKTFEEDRKKIKANIDANKAVGLMILAIVLLVFLLYIGEYKLHIPKILMGIYDTISIIVPAIILIISFLKAVYALVYGTDYKKRSIIVLFVVFISTLWVFKVGRATIEAKKQGTFDQYIEEINGSNVKEEEINEVYTDEAFEALLEPVNDKSYENNSFSGANSGSEDEKEAIWQYEVVYAFTVREDALINANKVYLYFDDEQVEDVELTSGGIITLTDEAEEGKHYMYWISDNGVQSNTITVDVNRGGGNWGGYRVEEKKDGSLNFCIDEEMESTVRGIN